MWWERWGERLFPSPIAKIGMILFDELGDWGLLVLVLRNPRNVGRRLEGRVSENCSIILKRGLSGISGRVYFPLLW